MAKKPAGKKFDTWEYADQAAGIRVKVPVYTGGSGGKIVFRVELEEFAIRKEDSDINRLKDQVFAEIKAQRSTTWTGHLYVYCGGAMSGLLAFESAAAAREEGESSSCDEESLGAEFRLMIRPVAIGTRPDGSRCYRDRRYYGARAVDRMPPVGVNIESPPEFSGFDSRSHRGTCALLPDTPENRRALAEIACAVEQLRRRLGTLLSPARIESSLGTILERGMVALEPPGEDTHG
jgi:hypothetical protein